MNRQLLPNCSLLLTRLSLLVVTGAAFAQSPDSVIGQGNRFALVIGNGDYVQGQLKNPANDAKLISESLRDLGFRVESKIDLNQQEMEEKITSFSSRLPKNSFAFFFFAGHGIQAKKANYLIPVGATIKSESSLKYRTVPLDFVRDELENSKSNLNVVVLDCCRNNPFERSWNRSLVQRGLAPVPPVPEGTVIAFATGDGKTAADGHGNNSPYTRELASALSARPSTGLSLVEGVFFTLGRTLKPKTQQHPHLYVDSTMPKYFLWKPETSDDANESMKNAYSTLPPSPTATSPTLAANSSKPVIDSAAIPNPKSAQGHELLTQASSYHSEGEFDYAITAFGALINDPDISRIVRDQARKGRGGSYLAKGTAESINRAIIDFKAAREPGIQLSVMRSEAELRDSKAVTGKVHRNEIVLLTQSKGDWLWVESVQGSKSRQGWIKCSAFLPTAPTSTSAATSIIKPNKDVVMSASIVSQDNVSKPQPSSSVVSKSEPLVQPLGTSATPFTSPTVNSIPSTSSPQTHSTSGSMIRFGPDGKPIGTLPPHHSQQVSLPKPQVPGQAQDQARIQSSGQQIIFDQHGKPITSWSQPPSHRSVLSSVAPTQVKSYFVDQNGNLVTSPRQPTATRSQSDVVYLDQNGRPVTTGIQQQIQTQQPVYQTQKQTYQPQRQQTYQPRQQTYQPQQQQTFQTRPSTTKSFGNQIRQPFQMKSSGSKMFQSPMRSHMERMKSFRFGN